MKDSVLLVFIVLMKALVTFTEDDASSVISCNTELLTWQEAVENCTNKGGYMLPFETGLGQNIDALHLQSEIDIWTADYIIKSDTGNDGYCGFNYLNSTFYKIRVLLYGDCYANRNYFCKSETGTLEVFNSTRESVHCNYSVQIKDLHSNRLRIKPGYYWNFGTLHGKASKARTMVNNLNSTLCGAFKSSIGMYYANCNVKRYSLCSSHGNGPINNVCFDGHTPKVTESSTIVTRTEHTTNVTNPTTMSMTSRQQTTADTSHKTTKHPMTVLTSIKDKTNVKKTHPQEEEQSSDIGIKVGVPLGIILPLTCGVLIIIYIYRKRMKCWQSSNPKHEKGRMNPFHDQETSPAHGQLIVYSESNQETPKSSDHHIHENYLTDISAQYAVVTKPKKGDTKSRKDNYSNKSCQNATNDEYDDDDEYDVAGRFQNSRSNQSDNLYNHFESVDEYNSTSFVREGECNNLYNTTEDRNLVEPDYDSTIQVNNTTLPDDVYNHLSQGENYYDSTSNTRNK
ncbi:uncharacterized protein LOC132724599 isoform X1 [Ruditapes philippinarum]|uniref:uncharacterized protein LOC132724599 isoform X1 n=1 Tax=Ruditapes philippinarum TaxID=129788 RepID=UPI00295ADA77|nr:uncharacterized protein LOC132724599 isoform X1 [Ruditapes philippinarum]